MKTLDEVVRETVEDFVQNSMLFTALDVSNKVKSVLPLARHREVRDLVRSVFSTHIEPAGWAHTPIQVTLADGSIAEAMLYHPLSASWDLDAEYDAQRRNQVSTRPSVASATVSANGTVTVSTPTQAPVAVTTPAVTTAQVAARDAWNQMFQNKPSLFPRKP